MALLVVSVRVSVHKLLYTVVLDILRPTLCILSPGQMLSTFHYTLLDQCRALLSVVERGWPNALDFDSTWNSTFHGFII